MYFTTQAPNGARSAQRRNDGKIPPGRTASPLNKDWVLISYTEPTFSDLEHLDHEITNSVNTNKDQDACSDVPTSSEACNAVSAIRMRSLDYPIVKPDVTATTGPDTDEQPINDMLHNIRSLLGEYNLSRKHYQDCHSTTTRTLQNELERTDHLFQDGTIADSDLDEGAYQALPHSTAASTQSEVLSKCDLELCVLEQRLHDKVSALLESSAQSRCCLTGVNQKRHDANGAEVIVEVPGASSETSSLLESYFERAGDVFVANERLIKLQEEHEDALAGRRPYPRAGHPTAAVEQNLHEIYECRRRALVERLADAEKHLMECREACIHRGINPEAARYRRISGTVTGRSIKSEEREFELEAKRNDPQVHG